MMAATVWRGEDIALVAFCIVLGLLAVAFFVTIFVADFRDSRRKTEARRALHRRRKHSH